MAKNIYMYAWFEADRIHAWGRRRVTYVLGIFI